MSSFRDVVCWKPKEVRTFSPRDAASTSSGVFNSVHHPLPLYRRAIGRLEGGARVSEPEIVHALLGELRPDGYLFVPVVGASGTGKSHLVRWVSEQVAESEARVTRYLPKNRTNLRSAIRVIKAGLDGPLYDEIEEELAQRDSVSETADDLANRVLDELAYLLGGLEDSETELAGGDRNAQMRSALRQRLPAVLRDPIVRQEMVKEDRAVARVVKLNLEGRVEGDGLDDEVIRFHDDDLPTDFETLGDAHAGAKEFLRRLGGSPQYKRAGLDLLNEVLPLAARRVFLSPRVNLIELFRAVRRDLHARGQELVLFIEDFTVLHGIEREFLDAIVEPVEAPEGRMCSLRLLFAVTEGHLEGLDTVTTRCDDAFWLDNPLGNQGIGEEEIANFVGRYLNAIRHGHQNIESQWATSRSFSNACESCEFDSESCHDTFGISSEGHGLYPYNREAIHSLVRAISGDKEKFDPRSTVRYLIGDVLLDADREITRREFPSNDLLETFARQLEPISAAVQVSIRERYGPDSDRATNLVKVWGRDGQAPRSGVFEAFGLSGDRLEITGELTHTRPTPNRQGSSSPHTATTHDDAAPPVAESDPFLLLTTAQRDLVDRLDQWASAHSGLRQSDERQIRQTVFSAAVGVLKNSALPLHLGADRALKWEECVSLFGGASADPRADAPIVLKPRPDLAMAVQGLLILIASTSTGTPAPAAAERYVIAAANQVESWAEDLGAWLLETGDPATLALHGLVISRLLDGGIRPSDRPSDWLRSLFRESTPPLAGSDGFEAVRSQLREACKEWRSEVEKQFGESRGGGVRMLRADAVLPALNLISRDPLALTGNAPLDRLIQKARLELGAEWTALSRASEDVCSALDSAEPLHAQLDAVADAADSAFNTGRLDAEFRPREFRESYANHGQASLSLASKITGLGSAPTDLEKIALVASPDAAGVRSLAVICAHATRMLESIEYRIGQGSAVADDTSIVEDVAAIDEIADGIKKRVEKWTN